MSFFTGFLATRAHGWGFPLHALSLCAPQGAGVAGFLRPATPGRPLTKFRSGDKTYRTNRVVKREGQAHAWPSFDLIFFKYSVSKGPKAPMVPCPSGGCGQSPRPFRVAVTRVHKSSSGSGRGAKSSLWEVFAWGNPIKGFPHGGGAAIFSSEELAAACAAAGEPVHRPKTTF